MYPKHHAVLTAIAAVPLSRRGWSWPALAGFVAAAVLIDIDHYVSYAWRRKDLSLRRAYDHYRGRGGRRVWAFRPHRPGLINLPERPLHAVVPLLVLSLAARRQPELVPIASGALFHRLLDYLWDTTTAAAERAPVKSQRSQA